MIAIQRFAGMCLNRLIVFGKTRMSANPNLDKMLISVSWRKLWKASTKEENERAAMDILIATLSYLAKTGTESIEGKLRERMKEKL